ncbi:MAG: membrane protein insertion efficiency factor YidD [Candidatus Omnitrophota bacterium]
MTEISIFAIKFYRNHLSRLKLPCCRFHPTCSEYSLLCLRKFGFLRALPRIVWRILRCNPFSKGGFDPVDS